MRPILFVIIAIALAASPKALAEESKPLLLKLPKSALSASAPQASAPFTGPVGETDLGLATAPEARRGQSRSSCSNEVTFCYDASENRIVFKPARNFMPDLPGMTRENITVKRDRIVFRYSF